MPDVSAEPCRRCGRPVPFGAFCVCVSDTERAAFYVSFAKPADVAQETSDAAVPDDPILTELRAIRELLECGAGRPVLNLTLGESIVSDQVLAEAIRRLAR